MMYFSLTSHFYIRAEHGISRRARVQAIWKEA
jgi:hypothetical protein